MLVYNLTSQPLVYRGRTRPPEGSYDFKDMTWVPDRDAALQESGLLAFGALPYGWVPPSQRMPPRGPVEKVALGEAIAVKVGRAAPLPEAAEVQKTEEAVPTPQSVPTKKKY